MKKFLPSILLFALKCPLALCLPPTVFCQNFLKKQPLGNVYVDANLAKIKSKTNRKDQLIPVLVEFRRDLETTDFDAAFLVKTEEINSRFHFDGPLSHRAFWTLLQLDSSRWPDALLTSQSKVAGAHLAPELRPSDFNEFLEPAGFVKLYDINRMGLEALEAHPELIVSVKPYRLLHNVTRNLRRAERAARRAASMWFFLSGGNPEKKIKFRINGVDADGFQNYYDALIEEMGIKRPYDLYGQNDEVGFEVDDPDLTWEFLETEALWFMTYFKKIKALDVSTELIRTL